MNKTLYVVVHEKTLRLEAKPKPLVEELLPWTHAARIKSQEVLKEVEGIKTKHPCLSVTGKPHILPANLPQPSPDLTIMVAGTNMHMCCQVQRNALLDAGHNARLDETACNPYDISA
jgi:hypothetical protein